VVEHPVTDRSLDYVYSEGAGCPDWNAMTNGGRLQQLLLLFIRLAVDEEIDADVVHEAFRAIPEYRAVASDAVMGVEN